MAWPVRLEPSIATDRIVRILVCRGLLEQFSFRQRLLKLFPITRVGHPLSEHTIAVLQECTIADRAERSLLERCRRDRSGVYEALTNDIASGLSRRLWVTTGD